MKTFLKLLFLFGVVLPSIGAQPPVIRNGWTTNAEALLPIRVYNAEYAFLGASIIPDFRAVDGSYYIGALAGLADDGTASASIGLGIGALQVCSNGIGNIAIGSSALNDLTNHPSVLPTMAQYNVAIGYNAGSAIPIGADGIYIGRATGPAVGGIYNICIGRDATYESAKTNTVSIGYNAYKPGDNVFVLGNSNMALYAFRGEEYTFPSMRGTNQYLFIGDAGQLYWTNVVSFTTNISGDSFTTNLIVYSNAYFYSTAYINNLFVTNLTVVSNAYFNETIYVNNAYITNLTVVSNAYFSETIYVNNEYVTNLTVVSNAYFPSTAYVSNLWATNVSNLPGPFVLLPHAPTNAFPNALSLSNGTGINFETNGQFLRVSVDTNTVDLALNTYGAADSETNYVVDFSKAYWLLAVTNNVNLVHSTNRNAGFVRISVIMLENNSGSNVYLAWPATWKTLNYTNYTTLTNGKFAAISMTCRGSSETNVYVAFGYQN